MDALLQKMKFQPGKAVAILDAPGSFVVTHALQATGQAYHESPTGKYDWLVLCVMQSAEVGIAVPRAVQTLAPKGMLWICYPQKSGKIKTDLSRDHGWDATEHLGLRHLNLISVDSDWSAWAVELGSNASSAKTRQKSEDREDLLAQYMDHKTREMRYPPEMEAVLAAHPAEQAFFLSQSFTNRKEYLEWIVTAKRPETRQQRLGKLIDYLKEGRINPAGR
jgi:Bacteriocin-protection, YdeI or OmpD-Associated